jgi:hypothetical protein
LTYWAGVFRTTAGESGDFFGPGDGVTLPTHNLRGIDISRKNRSLCGTQYHCPKAGDILFEKRGVVEAGSNSVSRPRTVFSPFKKINAWTAKTSSLEGS